MKNPSTLHLVLTHHWYDETVKRVDPKRIEYRAMTARWMRLIYGRRYTLKHVRFARGYSKTTATFSITRIDIGTCLLAGHEGERIRIHFTEIPQIRYQ